MDLQSTKICILFGLLISTSIAAMIPLLLIRTVEESEIEETKGPKKKKRGLMNIVKNWFPCFKKKQRSRLLSRLSIKTNSMRSANNVSTASGGHAHDMDVHGKRTTAIMSILNCFAGGVFLGTSFLGLMPEVREVFDEAGITWPQLIKSEPVNGTNSTMVDEEPDLLPMTEIVVTCGLFLILIVEQSVHEILSWHNKKEAKARKSSQTSSGSNLPDEETKLTLTSSINNSSGLELKKLSLDQPQNGTVVVCNGGDSPTAVAIPISPHHDEHKHHQDEIDDENEHHIVRSLILVVSLSMHSFLEGIAIGLQSQASSAVSIFVAVLLHKSLMAFSMGTSLVKANQTKGRVIKAAILFSVMSPIGIVIGMIMKNHVNHPNTDMVNGVLQGIATGTFLYITFFEVLAREFEAHGSRIQKTIALLLGYVAIFLMVMTQHGT